MVTRPRLGKVPPEPPEVGVGPLLVRRRGHGDDLEVAGVHRGRQPADRPPLPAASGPSNTRINERPSLPSFRVSRASSPCASSNCSLYSAGSSAERQVEAVDDVHLGSGLRWSGSGAGRQGGLFGLRQPGAGSPPGAGGRRSGCDTSGRPPRRCSRGRRRCRSASGRARRRSDRRRSGGTASSRA